jgi:hypothetical protein
MLSKRVIMREWREFLRKRDSMCAVIADENPDAPPSSDAPPNPEAPPNSPGSPPPRPGTPARAPAALLLVI